jgi:hypothetical protein
MMGNKEYCRIIFDEYGTGLYIANCKGKRITEGNLNEVVNHLASKGWIMKLAFQDVLFFERDEQERKV